jgi:uncharacterized membrane protein YkoI
MKNSFYRLCSIVFMAIFATAGVITAGSHEKKQEAQASQQQPKVSQKDAEHAVRFKFPTASIDSSEVVQGKGHANWKVHFHVGDAAKDSAVYVDGETGKVLDVP